MPHVLVTFALATSILAVAVALGDGESNGMQPTTQEITKEPEMNLTTQKVKRVGLVGHCSPDSSHLTMAISAAVPGAKVIRVTDDKGTDKLLEDGIDLLLVNRAMEHGYSEAIGTDYIRKLKAKNPNVKMMLISNYEDAQQAAIKEGALPGFGKSSVMAPETKKKLQEALKD